MSDHPERDNILPGDATPLERAIADTDGRLDDIDMDLVRRIGGPDITAVPAAFLAHRGWGRSVDVYDPAWPEAVKRAAIEAAPIVHRYKGTRYAVETALSALRVSTEIVEWWETVPKGAPYTFTVTAFARGRLYDGPLLDARLIGAVYSAVTRAKPLSRAFTLRVAATAGVRVGLAPVATARTRVRRGGGVRLDTASSARIGLAPVATTRTRVRRSALLIADMSAD